MNSLNRDMWEFENWPLYQVPAHCVRVEGIDKNGNRYEAFAINPKDIRTLLEEAKVEEMWRCLEICKKVRIESRESDDQWDKGDESDRIFTLIQIESIDQAISAINNK